MGVIFPTPSGILLTKRLDLSCVVCLHANNHAQKILHTLTTGGACPPVPPGSALAWDLFGCSVPSFMPNYEQTQSFSSLSIIGHSSSDSRIVRRIDRAHRGSRSSPLLSPTPTRSSADADNRLDAFSGQSRSTNMVPFHMLHIVSYCAIVTLSSKSFMTLKWGQRSLKVIESGIIR